ncbi:MAG: CoA-binding protein [Polyangiaceae bacterium]
MAELTHDDDIRRVLTEARVVAVLGAHPETGRAAFYVPDYLRDNGYRVIPVNPMLAGETLWDEPVRKSLADLAGERIDLVDVFRRSQALPGHVADILAMRPAPHVIWFQLGIRNDEVAKQLIEAGLDVVQDRCTLADHRRLRVPSHAGT